MAAIVYTSEDLLIDDAARRNWAGYNVEQQGNLLRWVNKPRTARARAQRRDEASQGLASGITYTGLQQMTPMETLREMLSEFLNRW